MIELPKVDKRTAADVTAELSRTLGLNRLHEDELRQRIDVALVDVFGRFSEIVIDRLNRAPEKKFLAFLEFLGLSPLPAEAASVPLTFVISPKASGHAVVPAGTRVSAAPAGGGKQQPVIFETLSELVVTATELDSLLVKNGSGGYADLAAAKLPVAGSPEEAKYTLPEKAADATFRPIPHILYVSVPSNPGWPKVDALRLQLVVEPAQVASPGERSLQWEMGSGPNNPGASPNSGPGVSLDADPLRPMPILHPTSDTTEGLTKSGSVDFTALPAFPVSVVNGTPAYWLCCRLITVAGAGDLPGKAPAPLIREVTVTAEHSRDGLPVDQAYYEKLALDVSKDFFPFGQRPRLGDALYLGCREAFSEPSAVITMHVELAKPDTPALEIPHLPTTHAELCWEFWDGVAWTALNSEADTKAPGESATTGFADETRAFTKSGIVRLRFRGTPAELNLNGMKNYWLRVRIAAGDYGREMQIQTDGNTGKVNTIPASLAPPCIRSVKIDYFARKELKPAIVQLDEWRVTRIAPGAPFRPFAPTTPDNAVPALYAGFQGAPVETSTLNRDVTVPLAKGEGLFPRLPINAYVLMDEAAVRTGTGTDQSAAMWEYWNGMGWKSFTVADQTQGLRKSGLVQCLPPGDFVTSDEFGKSQYWMRMRLRDGQAPPIRAVMLHTTGAIQGLTITDDILGSSTGEPKQSFHTTYPSVLAGQKLEVCEPVLPSRAEQATLAHNAGTEKPIQPANDKTGRPVYWVSWRQVDSFHASGPRDRAYTLDHDTGEVVFGDGVSGMIPPILSGNIRMKCYRTGGGANGNQPAQAVKQLVSAVPYVQKVINWVPATGGSDPEQMDAFVERGPRELRHRGRAVTHEDFEDLALRASREVVRARAVPQCDLRNDPNGSFRRTGIVSLIVVPRSDEAKPVPNMDLLARVKEFLDTRRLATLELVVVGPDYVRVDVEAEVVINRIQEANDVEQNIARSLNHYLHPVHGGPDDMGWDFGRLPERSDLYVLIERIPGVSYVSNVKLTMTYDRPQADKARHFLVYSGHHSLSMNL